MEWLSSFFIEGTYSVAVLVIIIIGIFIYAARRAHMKHLERLKKIDECYVEHVNPKRNK